MPKSATTVRLAGCICWALVNDVTAAVRVAYGTSESGVFHQASSAHYHQAISSREGVATIALHRPHTNQNRGGLGRSLTPA